MSKQPKPIGEWQLFKRRLGTAVACLTLAVGGMVWALVKSQPLWFIPAFMLIMGAWVLIMVAADTGAASHNPKVRRYAHGLRSGSRHEEEWY